MTFAFYETPLGAMALLEDARGTLVRAILPGRSKTRMRREIFRLDPAAREVSPRGDRKRLLAGYWKEGAAPLSRIPLAWDRMTPFARSVYRSARRIPAGETRSYGWVARDLGRPRAARAVGAALAANPVPLFVPCHRVVASDGRLTGFSAPGGLALKRRLLALERGRRRA